MEEKAYIYALCESDTKTVKYVGRSICPKRRLKEHIRIARNNNNRPVCIWIRELVKFNKVPVLVILEEVPNAEKRRAEKRWIMTYGLDNLLNVILDGGSQGPISLDARMKIGLANRGEGCGTSKLTESDVIEIREKYARGNITFKCLASEYEVATTAILRIVQHRTWKHIGGPPAPTEAQYKRSARAITGRSRSLETRQKISKGHIGKYVSDKTRMRISKSKKGISWGTHSFEPKTCLSKGKLGEKNPQSKLTKSMVLEIRKLYQDGITSLPELGQRFGVDGSNIWKVVNRVTWKQI